MRRFGFANPSELSCVSESDKGIEATHFESLLYINPKFSNIYTDMQNSFTN